MTLVSGELRTNTSFLNEVQYAQEGVGYFPHLTGDTVAHGFSWGPDSQNMSYAYHEGDRATIVRRNQDFLRLLGMNAAHAAVVASSANPELIDVNPTYLAEQSTPSGEIFVPAYALFTVLRRQPLAIKPGDCSSAIMKGWTGDGVPLIGIVHGSRKELDAGSPRAAVAYCETQYGCDPADLRVGIVPSIQPTHHWIRKEDTDRLIDTTTWRRHMRYDSQGDPHLDGSGLAIDQYIAAGVLPENIECYRVDTYDAAAQGEGFSHRYTSMTGERKGRFLVAAQII